ncbi:MAG TPA: hypothetical protein VJB94_02635 [Candidatus Nanoarchaeia archaeon]|nr:hypothetical protein [Candidatus Nanoarchaeia archaeon]
MWIENINNLVTSYKKNTSEGSALGSSKDLADLEVLTNDRISVKEISVGFLRDSVGMEWDRYTFLEGRIKDWMPPCYRDILLVNGLLEWKDAPEYIATAKRNLRFHFEELGQQVPSLREDLERCLEVVEKGIR